jgi:hypothetical protein
MNSIIKKQNLKNKQTFYEFQNNNQMRKDATKKIMAKTLYFDLQNCLLKKLLKTPSIVPPPTQFYVNPILL